MTWEISLGGTYEVRKNGKRLGQWPTKSSAVLFCALATQAGEFLSRAFVAAKLYPEGTSEQQAVALRQTLSRLRAWLGSDSIETQPGTIRLVSTRCTIGTSLPDGTNALFLQIAPGLNHQWMDELRNRWSKSEAIPQAWQTQSFVDTVCSLGTLDPALGRSMLIGGSGIMDHIAVGDLSRMFNITRPTKVDDPLAAEYALLSSHFAFRFGLLKEAEHSALKALRIARKYKLSGIASEVSAWMMFFSLEQGLPNKAAEWFPSISHSRMSLDSKLLSINARLAYHWNFGDFTDARSILREGLQIIHSSSRTRQLHFWSNTAIFSAEANDLVLAREALKNAESLCIPSIDTALGTSILHAKVAIFSRTGEFDEAVRISRQHIEACQSADYPIGGMYATEAHAEALQLGGRHQEAKMAWHRCETHRSAVGCKLTNRHRRQKAALC